MEERKCWLCGRNGAADPLDTHHLFGGWSGTRQKSEAYGLTVDLCHNRCHIFGPQAAHNCKATMDMMHRYGQRKAMLEQGWTVEEFRQVFGKNYLDENEIEAIRNSESKVYNSSATVKR